MVRVAVVIDRVCCLNPWWAIEEVSRLGEYVEDDDVQVRKMELLG